MEPDAQLLEDLLEFLRILKDVELPARIQMTRVRLLGRVQAVMLPVENYIHMKPRKPLDYDSTGDTSSEEYVTPDDQQQLQPRPSGSFLFSYQNKTKMERGSDCSSTSTCPVRQAQTYLIVDNFSPPPPTVALPEKRLKIATEEETEGSMIRLYENMTSFEAESKAHIFGELRRKEKRFFFETHRPFWAALVGFHLLTYDNRMDLSPTQILSLKECRCGPVANSPRNAKKQSDLVFEIHLKDERTIQFTASTTQQMEEWLAAIRQSEANSRDVADVPIYSDTSAPEVIQEENSSDEEEDTYEEYDGVIPDITAALGQSAKRNESIKPPPIGQIKSKPPLLAVKPKQNVPKKPTIRQDTPFLEKRINRVLPPTPTENGDEDLVYNEISNADDDSPDCRSASKDDELNYSMPTEKESDQAIYDDIEAVKEQVGRIAVTNNVKRELEKRKLPEAIETEGTYDDVEVLKPKVEAIRQIREPVKVERKPILESPKQPIKISPMKELIDRFRFRNNSPQKEEAKIKSPNPKEIPLEICSEESDSYVNNHMLKNLCTYNNPLPPRPIHDESVSQATSDEGEESFYYDVTMKQVEIKSQGTSSENETEKRRKADKFVAGLKIAGEEGFGRSLPKPLPKPKPQKDVVRNLNKCFEDEIYQNQSGDENIDDNVEHYQVPRGEANLQAQSSKEDDDQEEIYYDTEIALQKKIEVEKAKQKPADGKSTKNFKVPIVPKPNENSIINRLNKLSLTMADKSTNDKKVQNRFIIGKKSRVQENVKPSDHRKIMASDNEIYDDCQMNGSYNRK